MKIFYAVLLVLLASSWSYSQDEEAIRARIATLEAELKTLRGQLATLAAKELAKPTPDATDKLSRAEIIESQVYVCGPNGNHWCWADPNDRVYVKGSSPFNTKQEAINFGMMMGKGMTMADVKFSNIPNSATGITMASYGRISQGMVYAEVVNIIGARGSEISSSSIGGTTTEMYMWQGSGGASMNAMFQNGKLISKAQFGLR